MLRFRILAQLLTLFALFMLSACGDELGPRTCTEIGCTSGLTVELGQAIELTGDALLRLDFDFDGEARRCELRRGERPMVSESCGAITFDWEGDRLGRFVIHDRDPEHFGVEIRVADELLHEASLEPEYKTVQPNGPGCPPECRQALITL